MSKMSELDMLSYDIEQLWIEGRNPVQIADELDCHIDMVNAWIELNGLGTKDDGWKTVETYVD